MPPPPQGPLGLWDSPLGGLRPLLTWGFWGTGTQKGGALGLSEGLFSQATLCLAAPPGSAGPHADSPKSATACLLRNSHHQYRAHIHWLFGEGLPFLIVLFGKHRPVHEDVTRVSAVLSKPPAPSRLPAHQFRPYRPP